MNSSDMKFFFTDEETLDRESHLVFTYIFETILDPMEAAANLCSEMSTAQWNRPGVDEDFRPKFAAKVVNLDTISESSISVFSDQSNGDRFVTAKARIAYPWHNFGTKIPNLLTVALGEGAFFCHGITSIKLIDIEFPDSFLADFCGPHFGTKGIRHILDIADRPLFFGVVKPNVGLDPQGFASLAQEAWVGGLDVAKDDEMLADTTYSPFEDRMRSVSVAMKTAEDATGERKMFIANITDEIDRMVSLHDIAVANGINAVMVNVMAVGLSAVRLLRRNASVPIIAHFDCIAPMSRHPNFGVSTTVMTKLQRLCGCDAIIMPGFGERMMTPEEEVVANVSECTKLMGDIKAVLPVPGGSDWAGTLRHMYEKLRTLDFACVPGRGVFGHPMGPKAGAKSFRQAWEAIVYKVDLDEYAKDNLELSEAIAAFGGADKKHIKLMEPPIVPKIDSIRGYTGATLFLNRN